MPSRQTCNMEATKSRASVVCRYVSGVVLSASPVASRQPMNQPINQPRFWFNAQSLIIANLELGI